LRVVATIGPYLGRSLCTSRLWGAADYCYTVLAFTTVVFSIFLDGFLDRWRMVLLPTTAAYLLLLTHIPLHRLALIFTAFGIVPFILYAHLYLPLDIFHNI
jgi:hypothetical protein